MSRRRKGGGFGLRNWLTREINLIPQWSHLKAAKEPTHSENRQGKERTKDFKCKLKKTEKYKDKHF